MDNKNKIWASLTQSIGQIIGVFIGSTVFVYLNNLEFLNNYIYYTHSDIPIVTNYQFLLSVSTFQIIFSICLFVMFDENSNIEEDEEE